MQKKGSLKVLDVKDNGDWLIERNEVFNTLIPLAGDTYKKFDKYDEDSIFVGYSRGFGTSRDPWAYNYSKEALEKNMSSMIGEYNIQMSNGKIEYDRTKIAWNSTLEQLFNRNEKIEYSSELVTRASYRPFTTKWFYHSEKTIHEIASMPYIFPAASVDNLLICVAGVGVKKDFSCIMTDCMTDVQLMANGQCFPLYWYEDKSEIRRENKQKSLFDDSPSLIKHDGVSDFALKNAKSKYGSNLTKEDIFYYVYGYLHSPEYKESFLTDLKLALPRIGFVKNTEDFWKFVKAGRNLAYLHLNYEDVQPFETVKLSGSINIEDIRYDDKFCHVNKMRAFPEKRKVVYNKNITIENIPKEAFDYVINGRSAIEWIVDQYQYKVDKKSGIVNDPNDYAGGSYVLRLLLSVISVSVKTMEIIKNIPELKFEDE